MAVMFRRAVFSLYPWRSAPTRSPEHTCVLLTCGHPHRAPALRSVVQDSHRAFSSTRLFLCENKDSTSPSAEVQNDEGRTTELQVESKMSETTEPTELDQKTEPRTEAVNGGSGSEPAGHLISTTRIKDNEVKTFDKKGLLELLGTMKVTTKRKTRSLNPELDSTTSLIKEAIGEAVDHRESLSADLVAAATAAASTLPHSSQAKSELVQQLQKHKTLSKELRTADTTNIGNILAEMKVIKEPEDRWSSTTAEEGHSYLMNSKGKNSFHARRLNIFPADKQKEMDTELAAGLSLWDADLASQLLQVVNQQPWNGFEEMIQWTREGKMWQYPINNEAGLEEEASVPFHEHVFLERHLEDGFPDHGPVRHFMELVVTGLSKNHELTVQQKLEHIAWFREYFQQKQDVLKEAEHY